MTKKTYGQTSDGREIDDALVEALADEAERGFSPEQLASKPRGRGRPPLGDRAKTVESVRLDTALRAATAQRADSDGVTVSEVVRRALAEYLRSA
jgi:CRISPR-associated endonuclease/helicase Cas3